MKQIITTILIVLPVMMVSAQRGPLTGSGKLMSNTYDVKPFNKIKLIDLAGKADVEVGKPFAVAVDIDDNLAYLLSVSCEEGVLKIAFNDNQNNRLYIENTNIRIKIALPALNTLEHRGNNRVEVTGLSAKQLTIEKSGNGNLQLNGQIEELIINKSGNGEVDAGQLIARIAKVHASGNGNVNVNASDSFEANGSGNGDIQNIGTALATSGSGKSGNGRIIDAGSKKAEAMNKEIEKAPAISVRLSNDSEKRMDLKIVYPVKGSYGISLNAGETRKEKFPAGTKVYRDGNGGGLLFEITAEDEGKRLAVGG
ncbi:MAG: DUF2807 domain-containing protein [Bacteroidetes bacterium]|nr:DUF2807 domain-containing protein [Bacteroidota bacterium]